MNNPIDPDVRQEILHLNPANLMESWLLELQAKQTDGLFSDDQQVVWSQQKDGDAWSAS